MRHDIGHALPPMGLHKGTTLTPLQAEPSHMLRAGHRQILPRLPPEMTLVAGSPRPRGDIQDKALHHLAHAFLFGGAAHVIRSRSHALWRVAHRDA